MTDEATVRLEAERPARRRQVVMCGPAPAALRDAAPGQTGLSGRHVFFPPFSDSRRQHGWRPDSAPKAPVDGAINGKYKT
jgi:hypothetical protein